MTNPTQHSSNFDIPRQAVGGANRPEQRVLQVGAEWQYFPLAQFFSILNSYEA
jgi:hypothetical protein